MAPRRGMPRARRGGTGTARFPALPPRPHAGRPGPPGTAAHTRPALTAARPAASPPAGDPSSARTVSPARGGPRPEPHVRAGPQRRHRPPSGRRSGRRWHHPAPRPSATGPPGRTGAAARSSARRVSPAPLAPGTAAGFRLTLTASPAGAPRPTAPYPLSVESADDARVRTFPGYQRPSSTIRCRSAWAVPLTLDPDPDLFGRPPGAARETRLELGRWAPASRVTRLARRHPGRSGHLGPRPDARPRACCPRPRRRPGATRAPRSCVCAPRPRSHHPAAPPHARGSWPTPTPTSAPSRASAGTTELFRGLVRPLDRAWPRGSAVAPTSPGRPTAPTPSRAEPALRRLSAPRSPHRYLEQRAPCRADQPDPGRTSAAPPACPCWPTTTRSAAAGAHHLGPERPLAPSSSSPTPPPCSPSCPGTTGERCSSGRRAPSTPTPSATRRFFDGIRTCRGSPPSTTRPRSLSPPTVPDTVRRAGHPADAPAASASGEPVLTPGQRTGALEQTLPPSRPRPDPRRRHRVRAHLDPGRQQLPRPLARRPPTAMEHPRAPRSPPPPTDRPAGVYVSPDRSTSSPTPAGSRSPSTTTWTSRSTTVSSPCTRPTPGCGSTARRRISIGPKPHDALVPGHRPGGRVGTPHRHPVGPRRDGHPHRRPGPDQRDPDRRLDVLGIGGHRGDNPRRSVSCAPQEFGAVGRPRHPDQRGRHPVSSGSTPDPATGRPRPDAGAGLPGGRTNRGRRARAAEGAASPGPAP